MCQLYLNKKDVMKDFSEDNSTPVDLAYSGSYTNLLTLAFVHLFYNAYLFNCARSSLWQAGSNSLTRDQTQALCNGSTES